MEPKLSTQHLLLNQLCRVKPELAWSDWRVRKWIEKPTEVDEKDIKCELRSCMKTHYDKRAIALKDLHPLGIQVNLETGVANGVLVARSYDECANLIRQVMCNCLEFTLEDQTIDGKKYAMLRERTTGSVFRVVTGDPLLTNSFWNHYLV